MIRLGRTALRALPLYFRFFSDLWRYLRTDSQSRLRLRDLQPQVFNRTSSTHIDPHYLYQSVWATKHIQQSGTAHHVDVGSKVDFVVLLSAVTDVSFVDIRPIEFELEHFHPKAGDITALPFDDGALESVSCLHVIEHIGLGRYGDPIDPDGTLKAARELRRVLAPGGVLYLSLPIGATRICFNAHRVYAPEDVVAMFDGLELLDFCAVTDQRQFVRQATFEEFADARYSCGMFAFRAPEQPPTQDSPQ